MGIPFSAIDDAVHATQEMLIQQGAFTDMQTDLSDHVLMRELWAGRKKKFAGGNDWRADVQMDHNHSARVVGLYQTDGSVVQDSLVKAVVGPRHVNASYIYDQHEPDFQRGALAIVDLVRSKYTGMVISFYEKGEEILWGKPVDSSDLLTPFGVAYWVTKSATEGFNGGNPAGFPLGKGGLSQIAYPRWANWTAKYVNITDEDLVSKMERAHRKTKFRSPLVHSVPTLGSMKNGIYTNDTVMGLMSRLVRQNNTNLGSDITGNNGNSLFKSTPLTYAPYLDADTTDPIYMLDWSKLALGVMSGWEGSVGKPKPVAGMHLVSRVDMDVSMNMVCTDPRRQAVFSK